MLRLSAFLTYAALIGYAGLTLAASAIGHLV